MRISNLNLKLNEDESLLKQKAANKTGLKIADVKYFRIVKKSVDARNKNDIVFSYTVDIDLHAPKQSDPDQFKYACPIERIVVVGSGPAGLFSAIKLARAGLKPIVIERGSSVEERQKRVSEFFATRKLDTECNIQFGEGGAGTFSDGKLNTGVNGSQLYEVLEEFVNHGAPSEILFEGKPHIGSDNLPKVVKSIREEIKRLGGEFWFDTLFCGLKSADGKITELSLKRDGKFIRIPVSEVVLAIGHSSRDTYEMLFSEGVAMEAKDMAIGFRIEHSQKLVNIAQYGKFAQNPKLGAADYKLVSHAADRGVFTFCMCPGGVVVPATSEEGAVVTNGMSNFKRDGENANSAVVVQVSRNDYGEGALSGIEYLRKLERTAFAAGGSDYRAPAQLVCDFIDGKSSGGLRSVKPSYALGVKLFPLHTLLPEVLTSALQKGISDMDRKLRGFCSPDAVLTGVESRTSSPVRILRAENFSSVSFSNLYPCGETGFAGGITSSAMDGIKVAEKIKSKYKM